MMTKGADISMIDRIDLSQRKWRENSISYEEHKREKAQIRKEMKDFCDNIPAHERVCGNCACTDIKKAWHNYLCQPLFTYCNIHNLDVCKDQPVRNCRDYRNYKP